MDRGIVTAPRAAASRRAAARAGIWRLADPRISLASMASVWLGATAAAAGGAIEAGWLALIVVGILGIEVAKNASGEVFDFESGTDLAVAPEDRSPYSGGKRVMVDGLLTRGQTRAVAAAGYGIGIAAGLAIAIFREPGVLWLGLAGVSIAFFYHAPPFKLAYRGLGELAVGLCYGPGIAIGATWVQRGLVSRDVVLASIPLGLLIAAFLWINEFPDYRADLAAGKRNLVVRLGRPAAARAFAALVSVAILLLAALPLLGLPKATWLGLAAAVPATIAARTLMRHPEDTARIVRAQAKTLLSFLLASLGCGTGFLL